MLIAFAQNLHRMYTSDHIRQSHFKYLSRHIVGNE